MAEPIETAADLARRWRDIRRAFARDLGALGRLLRDPVGTLEAAGYVVRGEARETLQASALR
jgi:hypothetical protein